MASSFSIILRSGFHLNVNILNASLSFTYLNFYFHVPVFSVLSQYVFTNIKVIFFIPLHRFRVLSFNFRFFSLHRKLCFPSTHKHPTFSCVTFSMSLQHERDSLQPPPTPIPAPSFTHGHQAVRVTMTRVIRL